ncbi:MAG: cation transporter dimerization domain-containing protein, partial [Bacilli bacterium]|nr:cation transporter dimerization domain-containing protein [Bacilli bacterium]
KTEGVLEIDMVKTRMFGSKIYVDVEFKCDENLMLKEAHQIAENVHDNIEKEIPDVKHCMVHINPLEIK